MKPPSSGHALRTTPLLVAIVLMLGCAGSKTTTIYEGTYVRTWVELDGSVAQASGEVRLELTDDGHFEIEGTTDGHPPKGNGSYRRDDRQGLVLDDEGFSSGGYDMSLTLEGPFEVAEAGSSLVLTQENVWGHTHLLMLERVAVEIDAK